MVRGIDMIGKPFVNKRNELEAIFPPVRLVDEEMTGIPPEIFDFRREFAGLKWTEIPAKRLNRNGDVFSFLDPIPLKLLIGGFLWHALEDEDSLAAQSVVEFSFSPRFLEFAEILDRDQKKAFLDTVGFLIQDEFYSEEDRRKFGLIARRTNE